ncbi:MAG: hypothetical protein CMLOHMNK_00367 [Steroidobacteraceae bacterium]|nr:hypothetical protein [Steroidobacteraceae bacterium]
MTAQCKFGWWSIPCGNRMSMLSGARLNRTGDLRSASDDTFRSTLTFQPLEITHHASQDGSRLRARMTTDELG